jgi:bifunctional non-homologous end joining protein LigD
MPARTTGRKTQSTTAKKETSDDSTVAGVTLSNPQRVVYPEQDLTKLDLARYYEMVADWVLPHVADRPLTLVRCPQGQGHHCFYQKHLTEAMPDALRGVNIAEKGSPDIYVMVADLPGLVSLVQMGVLEIHPWGARADDVERPDRLVFDLDPGEGVTWSAVIEGAELVRDRLAELGLQSFVRTTGGKGLHVVVPITRHRGWEEVKSFCHALADSFVSAQPDRYIATMSKAKRRGKVFVDYLRNQRGATAVASYSTRARAGAPVATPLAWDELSPNVTADQFTVKTIPARLAKLKKDPWHDFFKLRQSLTAKVLAAFAS